MGILGLPGEESGPEGICGLFIQARLKRSDSHTRQRRRGLAMAEHGCDSRRRGPMQMKVRRGAGWGNKPQQWRRDWRAPWLPGRAQPLAAGRAMCFACVPGWLFEAPKGMKRHDHVERLRHVAAVPLGGWRGHGAQSGARKRLLAPSCMALAVSGPSFVPPCFCACQRRTLSLADLDCWTARALRPVPISASCAYELCSHGQLYLFDLSELLL